MAMKLYNHKVTSILFYFFSLLAPAIAMALAFYCNGIYPGSDVTLLIYDMDAQYVSFFGYLHNIGNGYNTLMFQTLSGMGGSFFGTWAYYLASPLSLIVLFFDKANLPDAIYFITLIKISLCGLSFYIYVLKGRIKCKNKLLALIGSWTYALIGYNMIYAMNLMWIDGVIMLPFVVLGADLLFEKKKPLPFILSLSLSIIFNYYTAYMIILYVVVHYVFVCVSYKISIKNSARIGFHFLISGILSLIISCFVLIPVLLDLSNGKFSENSKELHGIIRTPFSILRQLLPRSYGGLIANDAPPIYCGLVILFFFVVYFFLKEIHIRKKVIALSVCTLFVIALCWDRIDVIFHGFRIPDCYPARYSFIICFFLISVALESIPAFISKYIEDTRKTIAYIIICAIVLFDMTYNAAFTFSSLNSDNETGGYVERFYYDYYYLQSEFLKENTTIFSANTSVDVDFNFNDGLLYGIPSIDYFSSSYNLGIAEFLRGMGLNVVYNVIRDQGLCPLSASLLNVEYYYLHFNDSEIPYYVDYFNHESESGIFVNPYSLGLGGVIYDSSSDCIPLSYNAFENLNSFCFSLTGRDDVFVDCNDYSKLETFIDESGYIIKSYTIHPIEGRHLYLYVSPADYYASSELLCDDEIYLGDRLIATYKNVGDRYLIDLGLSDGNNLTFTLKTSSDISEAYFYYFDDDSYYASMEELNGRKLSSVNYSSRGISAEYDCESAGEVLLLLPYQDGYYISVDGVETEYESYMDSLIRVSVPSGHHELIIRFRTPGLVLGIIASSIGVFLAFIYLSILKRKRKLNEAESSFIVFSESKTFESNMITERNNISNKTLVYFLSFIIPVIVAFIAFYNQGIYIGGTNTVLIYDLRGQILPLYGYLSNFGEGYNTLLHTMSGGLGGNFWGDLTYYYSPMDFIYCFADVESLPDLIYIVLLIRIGLCGLFASIYAYSRIKSEYKNIFTVLLSCCYALMSFNFAYSMLPMWFDCVMLLPLLAMFLENIISGKRSYLFVLVFSICIISNFYIAYMNAIALFLFFVFRSVEEGLSLKTTFRRIVSLFLHGVISAGICSVFLVPSLIDFSRGRLVSGSIETADLFIKNNLFDVFRSMFPMGYYGLDSNQSPYIFCGSIIALLSFAWLFDKNTSLKTRITGALLIAFYFISFILGPFDRFWHGFSDPVGFSCRYSFTFVFVLIVFSIRSINFLSNISIKCSDFLKRLLVIGAFTYTLVELTLNASFMISSLFYDYNYSNRDEYRRYSKVILNGLSYLSSNEDGHERLAKNFSYSVFDGALYGYEGLQLFSSSYNSSVIEFLQKLGLDSYNSTLQETGLTPPVADFLNIGSFYSYWFDKSNCYEEIYTQGAYHLYDNPNVLPLGIALDNGTELCESWSANPLENINSIFDDISSFEDTSVFKTQDYTVVGKSIDVNALSDTGEVLNINFIPEHSGYYFLYRTFGTTDGSAGMDDNMPAYIPYLYFYADGEAIGTYGYNHHRYIGEIGYLNEGQSYEISLDDQYYAAGQLYIYYYDHELCTEICNSVDGTEVEELNDKGITLSGRFDHDTDLLVSLPCEAGYVVKVNGVKVTPEKYRDALMLLHLDSGENIIHIDYRPQGLTFGALISCLFMVIFASIIVCFRCKTSIDQCKT